jgi:hypothetical protein
MKALQAVTVGYLMLALAVLTGGSVEAGEYRIAMVSGAVLGLFAVGLLRNKEIL